jgi:hypothetical protein
MAADEAKLTDPADRLAGLAAGKGEGRSLARASV